MFNDPFIVTITVVALVLVGLIVRKFVVIGRIDKIEKLIEAKQFEKAIPYLKAMIAKKDEDILAHYFLGLCYFQLNNYEWAMPEFKKVIRSPKIDRQIREIDVREKLARIYLHYDQLEEAQKEFVLMTQLDPKNYQNYLEIAMILQKQGYLDAAINYYQKALERNPKLSDAYYQLGLISYERKKFNDALSLFTDTIKYDSSNYKAHYYLGMIYYANKNFERALSEFNISEKDSEVRQKTVLQKGKVFAELGQIDRSLSLYESHLKSVSNENQVTIAMRYNLASLYETKRSIMAAIEQWEKIAKLKPNYMDVQDKLTEYQDLRVDDRIKDFIVASKDSFILMCRNIIEMWNFQILKEDYINDERMEFVATEAGTKFRNTKKFKFFILIMRRNVKVEEREIADLLDTMKVNNAIKGIVISISGFTDQAKQYCQNRPFDLIEKEKLSALLNEAEAFGKSRLKEKMNNLGGKQ